MLKPFRTYRSLIRITAMMIFLASALPLIGHVCMMADAHHMPAVEDCCNEDSMHENMHAGMKMKAPACDDEKAHADNMEDECCSVDLQNTDFDATLRTSQISEKELIASALVYLASHSMFNPVPRQSAGSIKNTGPPEANLPSLHLLHSRFLI